MTLIFFALLFGAALLLFIFKHIECERLKVELRLGREMLESLKKNEEEIKVIFKALSRDALNYQQGTFFELAKETFQQYQIGMQQKETAIDALLKPFKESLEKVDHKIVELEKTRVGAYSAVTEQLRSLRETQGNLEKETSNLVKALRTPHIRGQWGELQLKRVVELAGMVEHCDFTLQVSEEGVQGRLRPDLIVKLPNNREIIVDAKAPLHGYLEAVEAKDAGKREEHLQAHVRHIRKHIQQLSEKGYVEQFTKAADFVVLFLPTESIFSEALQEDPLLIEYGLEKQILLATPTTLIALLRAVAIGWREEKVAEHAAQISDLGRELYERLSTMGDHLQKLKRSLDSSCEAYNKVAGSFEGRVLVSARKFQELGVARDKAVLAEPEAIEKLTRSLEAAT